MDELIPIVAMSLTLGPLAVFLVSVTPLGRALTERLRGGNRVDDERLFELQEEVERLSAELRNHEAQVEDIQDRLDFTERLLAKPDIEVEKQDVVTPV